MKKGSHERHEGDLAPAPTVTTMGNRPWGKMATSNLVLKVRLLRAILAAMIVSPSTASYAAAQSLCAPSDEVVFSCQLKKSGKQVALCASKSLQSDSKNGYVIYRFGKPGNIELEYPPTAKNSAKRFRFFHYFRPGLDTTEVEFENNGYGYAIFDSTGDELNSGHPEFAAGVRVSGPKGGGDATLECLRKTVFASWGLIEGVVPCDAENSANTCRSK